MPAFRLKRSLKLKRLNSSILRGLGLIYKTLWGNTPRPLRKSFRTNLRRICGVSQKDLGKDRLETSERSSKRSQQRSFEDLDLWSSQKDLSRDLKKISVKTVKRQSGDLKKISAETVKRPQKDLSRVKTKRLYPLNEHTSPTVDTF